MGVRVARHPLDDETERDVVRVRVRAPRAGRELQRPRRGETQRVDRSRRRRALGASQPVVVIDEVRQAGAVIEQLANRDAPAGGHDARQMAQCLRDAADPERAARARRRRAHGRRVHATAIGDSHDDLARARLRRELAGDPIDARARRDRAGPSRRARARSPAARAAAGAVRGPRSAGARAQAACAGACAASMGRLGSAGVAIVRRYRSAPGRLTSAGSRRPILAASR